MRLPGLALAHGSRRLTVYGDVESGYIVAPPVPSHPASPRAPRPKRTSVAAVSPSTFEREIHGRPTGSGRGEDTLAWMTSVTTAFADAVLPLGHASIQITFRLEARQPNRSHPDVCDLLTSTTTALRSAVSTGASLAAGPGDGQLRIHQVAATMRTATAQEGPGASVTLTVSK